MWQNYAGKKNVTSLHIHKHMCECVSDEKTLAYKKCGFNFKSNFNFSEKISVNFLL